MPIYEYRREDGTTFELLQPMSDDALTVDPDTGQKVQRILFAPAVHFKGSGFYNTDYGTKRRSREMEKSAAEGADKNDAKAKESKKDAKETKKDTSAKPASSADK